MKKFPFEDVASELNRNLLEAFGQTEGNVDDVIRPSLVANNERRGEADVLITIMEEENMDLIARELPAE